MTIIHRLFGILLSLGIFSACTLSLSREEQVENILSTPSLTHSETQVLESPFFARGNWPEKTWWEQFHSKELNSLIEKALVNNPSIQAVQERIEYAKSQAVIARSELLPLIYFDASDEWQYLSKNGLYRALNPDIALSNSQIDFSLSFFYEFDFWGQYRNLYKAALSQQQSAVAESSQVELITATALAQSYFALRTNLLRKKLYDQLCEVRKKYFDLQTKDAAKFPVFEIGPPPLGRGALSGRAVGLQHRARDRGQSTRRQYFGRTRTG